MMPQTERNSRGGGVWILLAGFAVATLITLAAAIGTSMWQQDPKAREFSPDVPMARR